MLVRLLVRVDVGVLVRLLVRESVDMGVRVRLLVREVVGDGVDVGDGDADSGAPRSAYTFPFQLPTTMEPSAAIAGEDVTIHLSGRS